jgi:hypothetical protein
VTNEQRNRHETKHAVRQEVSLVLGVTGCKASEVALRWNITGQKVIKSISGEYNKCAFGLCPSF